MDAAGLQQILTLAAGVLLAFAGGGALLVASSEVRMRAQRRARLTAQVEAARAATFRSDDTLGGKVTAGFLRMGQRAAVKDPAKLSAVRSKLMRAGFFSRESAAVYLGARAAALIVATIGTVLLLPLVMKGGGLGPLLLAGGLSAAAVLGPDQVLKMRRQARELEYTEGFPDLLDLLVASVEAGLSLDAAVSRVTDELVRRYPNLAVHLRFLTLELRAGKSRKEAWLGFADRLGIDDARALATMLRQAEDMGTSLGETLSVFSSDMRAKRMLRAEEKALALPAKLTVPLILFIFPCLLGVLLLPAIFRLVGALGGQ
ncbi:MAG: type II secretion system F family protein [Phenylobacterium sp.]|uniref:type II secretion system F family protein n=1 Tax=Phenylobacterium sp. TaxID=1871053 RepID=UPI00391BE048